MAIILCKSLYSTLLAGETLALFVYLQGGMLFSRTGKLGLDLLVRQKIRWCPRDGSLDRDVLI